MRRALLYAAALVVAITLPALGKEYLTTLRGFEAAFRRAHDSHRLSDLERLVCWDRTTEKMRHDMREVLREGLRDRIDGVDTFAYAIEAQVNGPLQHANIKPSIVFRVRYLSGREEGHRRIVETHYIVGKKDETLQFVVGDRWPISAMHLE
jgi:hypothetical protein